MTTYFEHNLETVKSKLLLMGQMANESLKLSIQALLESDSALAKSIREKDREIDELENELSVAITTYLSTHAPVAADLRLLVATMKISHEIERIGDESKAIARRSRKTTSHDFHKIPKMAKIAQEMLKDALSVFVEYDEEKAKDIWRLDLEVDRLHQENNGFAKPWSKRIRPKPLLCSRRFSYQSLLKESATMRLTFPRRLSLSLPVEMFVMLRNIKNPPSARK